MIRHLALTCLGLFWAFGVTASSPGPVRGGEAQSWTISGDRFAGQYVIETAFMRHGTKTWMFYDCNGGTKLCKTLVTDAFWTQPLPTTQVMPESCRFFSLFNDNAGLYHLICNDWAQPGTIKLYTSPDLETWTIANGGDPILTPVVGSNWEYIWNVSVARVGDTYVMLAEASQANRPGGPGMDLYLATAQWQNGRLNFNPGRVEAPVIPLGGNPDLRLHGDGKTLIALHGMYRDARFGGAWYITASVAQVSDLLSWSIKRDEFSIGETGVDIADPALHIGYDSSFIMFSYGQGTVRIMNPSRSAKETFDALVGR